MAHSDPPPNERPHRELTGRACGTIADALGVSLPFKRIDTYVAVGVLPDPADAPWVEEGSCRG